MPPALAFSARKQARKSRSRHCARRFPCPPLPLPPRMPARSVQDLPAGVEGAGLAPNGRARGEVARAPAQGGARRGA
eukprot:2957680-Prymnesium_polylepis.1